MDRKLLMGALLLLIIEVTYLLIDLGLVPSPFAGSRLAGGEARTIGEMKRTEQNVRRRGRDSIVWERSESSDKLFEYDAVLTLEGSAAQIQLAGDTRLNLDENTLVVLEPVEGEQASGLRLKFSRGSVRSRNTDANLELATETWTIEAEKGTELSLRSLDQGEMELEVLAGQARVKNAEGRASRIEGGSRVKIDKDVVQKPVEITSDLRWSEPDRRLRRVYGHDFPVAVSLGWEGEAERIRVIGPDKKATSRDVSTTDRRTELRLTPGTYHLSLESAGRASQTLSMQVWRAPVIRYFTPLPRDRVKTATDVVFAWEPVAHVREYWLEFSRTPEFNEIAHQARSSGPQVTTRIPDDGEYHWRVRALDEERAVIPESYSNPLFSVRRPLGAPTLKAPELRAPAEAGADEGDEEKKAPADGARLEREGTSPRERRRDEARSPRERESNPMWRALFDSILAPALAQEAPGADAAAKAAPEPQGPLEAEFGWQSVDGADHYVIEISREPDFRAPLVNQTVREPRFVWSRVKKGVYYWRVAAGTDEGQKGLFSEAARADLSVLNVASAGAVLRPASAKTAARAGTRPLEQQGDLSELKAKRPQVKETAPEQQAAEPVPEPTPVPSQDPVFKDEAQSLGLEDRPGSTPAAARASRPWMIRGHFGYTPHYRQERFEKTGDLKGEFSGFVPLSFASHLELPTFERADIEWDLAYHEYEWRKKNKAKYPFQSDLRAWAGESDFYFRSAGSAWAIGAGVEKTSVLERVEPERAVAKDRWLLGPSLKVGGLLGERQKWGARVAARTGQDLWLYRAELSHLWTFRDPRRNSFWFGERIGYGYETGEKMKSRIFEAGLFIGFSW